MRNDNITRPRRLPAITWKKPRCPNCGNSILKKYRSERDHGDGHATWWVKCANISCQHRFRVVLE